MMGSYFYLYTQRNWEYNEMYMNFYERKINSFAKSRGFDLEKEKALDQYVKRIETHLKLFDSQP